VRKPRCRASERTIGRRNCCVKTIEREAINGSRLRVNGSLFMVNGSLFMVKGSLFMIKG
jgi:hypothetical protein